MRLIDLPTIIASSKKGWHLKKPRKGFRDYLFFLLFILWEIRWIRIGARERRMIAKIISVNLFCTISKLQKL